jgi:hypothetical protein
LGTGERGDLLDWWTGWLDLEAVGREYGLANGELVANQGPGKQQIGLFPMWVQRRQDLVRPVRPGPERHPQYGGRVTLTKIEQRRRGLVLKIGGEELEQRQCTVPICKPLIVPLTIRTRSAAS